jgi:NADPH-dependent curcumin reductase CurA
MDSLALQSVQDPQGAFPWPRFCSCLGVPGMAAYVGIEKFADVKAVSSNHLHGIFGLTCAQGQTIYVSSGASGVGRYVEYAIRMPGRC